MDRRAAGDGTHETVDGRGPEAATVQGAVGESRVSSSVAMLLLVTVRS